MTVYEHTFPAGFLRSTTVTLGPRPCDGFDRSEFWPPVGWDDPTDMGATPTAAGLAFARSRCPECPIRVGCFVEGVVGNVVCGVWGGLTVGELSGFKNYLPGLTRALRIWRARRKLHSVVTGAALDQVCGVGRNDAGWPALHALARFRRGRLEWVREDLVDWAVSVLDAAEPLVAYRFTHDHYPVPYRGGRKREAS